MKFKKISFAFAKCHFYYLCFPIHCLGNYTLRFMSSPELETAFFEGIKKVVKTMNKLLLCKCTGLLT